jgi:hypothetical protein
MRSSPPAARNRVESLAVARHVSLPACHPSLQIGPDSRFIVLQLRYRNLLLPSIP